MAYLLAEWTLRSTFLIGVAGALLWGFRVKNVGARQAAWTAVLAGVLLIPVLSLVVPRFTIPVPRPWMTPARMRSEQSASAASFPVKEPPAGLRLVKGPLKWAEALAWVWLIGAAVMVSRLLVGLFFTRRLLRQSHEVEAGVFESDAVAVPVTAGLFCPVVILPADWRDWAAAKLRAVLAHEKTHVRGYDPLRRFAAGVYRALCWHHPLAWWLSAHLAELAEAKSDDAALADCGDEALYAETLLEFWERTPRVMLWEGVAMARSGKLTKRLERILDRDRPLTVSVARGASLALLIAAVPVIYLSSSANPVLAAAPQTHATSPAPSLPVVLSAEAQAPSASPQAMPPPVPASEKSGPYAKWLNEDVTYVVSPAERLAFERLRTDAEREHFVEQFWLARDPAAKTEHYRRIAYVNDHYAAGVPGWKTDRGRIYITFGPPDEIESHPTAAGGEPPSELWMYHHLEGIGDNIVWKFVDKSLTGEYNLALWDNTLPASRLDVQLAPATPFPPSIRVAGPSDGPVLFRQYTVPPSFVISVPLGDSGAPMHIFGRVLNAQRRPVESFEATLSGPLFERQMSLQAGSYSLTLAVNPAGGGTAHTEEISLEVK